jgi:hypothetical protein
MNDSFKRMTNAEFVAYHLGKQWAETAYIADPDRRVEYGYGTDVITLTREDIQALLDGQILQSSCEEYGVLIVLATAPG